VCAATFFLVACGDNAEQNDYVDQVNEVQTTLESDISDLSQTPQSPDELTSFYDDTVASLNEAATSLENIEPPDDVKDLHEKLISEVQDLSGVIQEAADSIKQGGAASVPGAVSQLATEGSQIQSQFSATIDEINSKLQD